MANSNISIKIDLLKIPGAVKHVLGKNNDVSCIVIPIAMANLFNGEKGVYMDLTAIPLTNPREGSKDTHLVKQSFSKEKFAAMTEEEKKALPILGNAIVWGDNSNNNNSSTPAAATTPPPSWL